MRYLALLLILACPCLACTTPEPTVTVLMPGVLTAGETGEVTVTVAAASVEVVIKASMSWEGGQAEAECPLRIIYPTKGSPIDVLLPAELAYIPGTVQRDGQWITALYLATSGRLICPIPAGTIAAEVTFGVTVK